MLSLILKEKIHYLAMPLNLLLYDFNSQGNDSISDDTTEHYDFDS